MDRRRYKEGKDAYGYHATVQLCPKLRELDHCICYEKHFAWRRIASIREGEFGERVRYEVRKPTAKWVSNLATTFL